MTKLSQKGCLVSIFKKETHFLGVFCLYILTFFLDLSVLILAAPLPPKKPHTHTHTNTHTHTDFLIYTLTCRGHNMGGVEKLVAIHAHAKNEKMAQTRSENIKLKKS